MINKRKRRAGVVVVWWILAVIIVLAIAVMFEEQSGLIRVGDPAPDFSAALSDGKQFTLSDYRGKNPVVLYFYPADFTMGCTQQACAFRDTYSELRNTGAVVVGISRDSIASHLRFSREYRLPFPLISDLDGAIGKEYGINRLGGLVGLRKRVTYVIDKEGIVRAAIHHEVFMQRHIDDVREALRKLDQSALE